MWFFKTRKGDPLMRMCGIRRIRKTGPTDEQYRILMNGAEHFLRGCGIVTPSFWCKLTKWSRVALVMAGDTVRREQAVNTGLAAQSPMSAAVINQPLDGGDMARRVLADTWERNELAKLRKLGKQP